MLRRWAVFAITVTLLLPLLGGTARGETLPPPNGEVVPGQFIVILNQGNDPELVARTHGLSAQHMYRGAPLGFAAAVADASLAALRSDSRVAYVEPDYVRRPTTELGSSWGVNRIDAENAHAAGFTGTGIKVGVIDTGIDFTHTQLSPRCAGGWDFVSNVPISCGTNSDGYGHGSHVSGTIAAVADGSAVIGVAPEASLYDLKVCTSSGSCATSNIIAALQYAADNDFDVVNISLGSRFASSAEQAAVDAAYSGGVFVVAAAGNSGNCGGSNSTIEFPGGYANAFAVAAVNKGDQRPCFSSTGSALDLAGPGVDVLSTVPTGNCTLCDPTGYRLGSGTSMATPHVAGTAALIKQANSSFFPSQIRDRLTATADDLGASGFDARYGNGLVDAEQAVLGTQAGDNLSSPPGEDTTAPTVTAVSPTNGTTNISVATNITVSFSEPVEPTTVTTATFTLSSAGGPVSGAVTVAADSRSATLDPTVDLASNTLYTVTITGVADLNGNALDQDDVTSGAQPFTSGFKTALAAGGGAPLVDSCSPSSASPNAQLAVSVTGSNIQSGATADFGDRVTVQSVTFVSSSQLNVQIKVHPKASSGPRTVVVTNSNGQAGSKVACFAVN